MTTKTKTAPKKQGNQESSAMKAELERLLSELDDGLFSLSSEPLAPASYQVKEVRSVVIQLVSDRAGVLAGLETVADNVLGTVGSLAGSSEAIDDVSSHVGELENQSATFATAIEEIGATIAAISESVGNTVEASNEAQTYAVEGSTVIDGTLTRIEQVDTVLVHANKALAALLDAAEQADLILRVVNDISNKTDLLALNASIEAARAGAAGKGFAVVAHEVGRLSEKTQASLSEIDGIIRNIRKNVTEVSRSIAEGSESATAAVKEAKHAKGTFNSITERISHVDEEVSSIGSALSEQSDAVADLSMNIITIAEHTSEVLERLEHVGALTNDAAMASNSTRNKLSEFPLGVRTLLGQFKIDHLFWMHRLRRMVDGRETVQSEEFTDHHHCRLGKWYDTVDLSEQSSQFERLYQDLARPHRELHVAAARLIRLYHDGNHTEAMEVYEQCRAVSTVILDTVDSMQEAL